MNIDYIKREARLSELTGSELPTDVKRLVNYFKSLTHSYEKKGGTKIWYDKNGQWTIEMEEKWLYISRKHWSFLLKKYGLNHTDTKDLIKTLLELILKRKISPNKSYKVLLGSWS